MPTFASAPHPPQPQPGLGGEETSMVVPWGVFGRSPVDGPLEHKGYAVVATYQRPEPAELNVWVFHYDDRREAEDVSSALQAIGLKVHVRNLFTGLALAPVIPEP